MEKVALVTGASSGIGAATAAQLLDAGFVVYAAARRLDRMAALASAGARLLPLDLADEASIAAAVARIQVEAGRLDVLVNNAGYGSYGAIEDLPVAEVRRQFEINVFAAGRLIQMVLPMMRAQGSGRIVNVSSVGGTVSSVFCGWYHASKHALEGMSDTLRLELMPFGIDVVLIVPGPVRSEWADQARASLTAVSGDSAYAEHARRAAAVMKNAYDSGVPSPPEVVARTIVGAIRAARPRTRYAVGGNAPAILFAHRWLGERLWARLVWRMLRKVY